MLRRVASLRPECGVLDVLERSTAADLDPGLVLEQSEASLMRLELRRAPIDEASTQGHAFGVAGAVLGVLAVITTYAGAASSSCDHVPFGESCDVTPRTALLATGAFAGVSAIALSITAIVFRIDLGRARDRWAVAAFEL